MLCAEISMMAWNGATKTNHETPEKMSVKGMINTSIYLTFLVDTSCCCLQWVGRGCGSKKMLCSEKPAMAWEGMQP
jgi:hypothetical protein